MTMCSNKHVRLLLHTSQGVMFLVLRSAYLREEINKSFVVHLVTLMPVLPPILRQVLVSTFVPSRCDSTENPILPSAG